MTRASTTKRPADRKTAAAPAGGGELLSAALKKLHEGEFMTEAEKAAFEKWDGYMEWEVKLGRVNAWMEDGSAQAEDYRWFIQWGGFSADRAVLNPACPPEVVAEGLSSENKWVREAAVNTAFRRGIRFAVAS